MISSKIRILGLFASAFLMASCAGQTAITDPNYGTWNYIQKDGKNTLIYVSPNGTRVEGIYATTGFFDETAIVAACEQYNESNNCKNIQYGFLNSNGDLAPNFGMYNLPQIKMDSEYPPSLQFEQIDKLEDRTVTKDFPLWYGFSKTFYYDRERRKASYWNGKDAMRCDASFRFVIEKDGRFGYIDVYGNVIAEPVYLAATPFLPDGFAYVVDENFVFGTVDEDGNFKKEKYACMTKQSNGIWAYENGSIANYQFDMRFNRYNFYISIDLEKRRKDLNYKNLACVDYGDSLGLLDSNMKVLIPNKFSYFYTLSKDKNNILAKTTDGYWGYYKSDGEELIPPKYKSITPAKYGAGMVKNEEGLLAVCRTSDCWSNTGFLYSTIVRYYETDDDNIEIATSKFVEAKKGDKWGVVSIDGVETTAFIYDELIYISSDGDMMMSKIGEKYGIIRNGAELYPAEYSAIAGFDNEGKALAKIGDRDTYVFKSKELEQQYWRAHRPPMPPRKTTNRKK